MISEDYVSFETAKLLKEKGFDEPTTKSYYTEGFENPMIFSHDLLPCIQTDEFLCPTLQMAMKWLRKVHNIHVVPKFDFYAGDYTGRVYDGRRENTMDKDDYIALVGNRTYEEAAETAIKYCLEKLI